MKYNNKTRPPVPSSSSTPSQGGGSGNGNAGGAKNLWNKTGHHWNLDICTYNVLTLMDDERITELEEELSNIKWDVVGICETRRKGAEKMRLIDSGNVLFCQGHTDKSQAGVGFLINKNIADRVTTFKGISERIISITLKLNKNYKIQMIQVYAPTSSYSDEEVEEFYHLVDDTISTDSDTRTIIMGDFNAKVGLRGNTSELCTGKFGSGTRNERGERLIEFATFKNLKIENTYFRKRPTRRWTWRSPGDRVRNEIDYFLTNISENVKDVSTLNRVNIGSDHRVVRCKLHINTAKERLKRFKTAPKPDPKTLVINRSNFQTNLKARLDTLHQADDKIQEDLDAWYSKITEIAKEEAISAAPKEKQAASTPVSQEIKLLLEKRRTMKSDANLRNKIEYTELCKTIRKMMRESTRRKNMEMLERTLKSNGSVNRTRKKLNIGRNGIICMKDKSGKELNDVSSVLNRIKVFYEELYNSSKPVVINVLPPEVIEDHLPPVTSEEVHAATKKMKREKAAGTDGMIPEIFMEGGTALESELALFFTACISSGRVPKEWKESELVLIHKKGDKKDLNNYRPISLLAHCYKLFTRCILSRIEAKLDCAQPMEQAGFRRGFSTMEHLHTLNQIREKSRNYNLPLGVIFVDFEKAFDSVEIHDVLDALTSQGVEHQYVLLLKEIYSQGHMKTTLGTSEVLIEIKKGVRQGDTISPKLFVACLEKVFSHIDWEGKGLLIDGQFLHHLRFADDIILIADNSDDLQIMLNDLQRESAKCGMKINIAKTKTMSNNLIDTKKQSIQLEGKDIELVNNYIYLGQNINLSDPDQREEIQRRIRAGWANFGRNKDILKSKLPLNFKKKIFNQCVLPAMTYGAETWTMNKLTETKLAVTQRAMERSLIGISRRDRWTNQRVRQASRVKDILIKCKELKWQWAGHIARSADQMWSKRTTEWTPRYGKRHRGRPCQLWSDELAKHLGTQTWARTAKDRVTWKHHGEAYIQQWIEKA